jgi:hypothetical protein
MSDTLEFWKNMALQLKDEWVQRGDRIAELEAQLAERWQPVKENTHIKCMVNEKYGVFLHVHDQDTIEVYDPSGDTVEQIFVFLPDEYRLCRLTKGADDER